MSAEVGKNWSRKSALARTDVEIAHRLDSSGGKGGQGRGGNARGKPNLSGTGGEIEDAVGRAEGVVGGGVVNDLRVVNAEAAAEDGLAVTAPVVGKADARSEVLVGVGEGLALVAQAKVQGEVGNDAEIILHEQRPHGVVDDVAGVAVALGVAPDVGQVIEKGGALADGDRLAAHVVGKRAEEDGAAEFLAVTATAGVQNVGAELQRVPSVDRGQRVANLVLAIEQLRPIARCRS